MNIYLTSLGSLSIPLDETGNELTTDNVSRVSLSPIQEDDQAEGPIDRYWRELTIEAWHSTLTIRLSSNDRKALALLQEIE